MPVVGAAVVQHVAGAVRNNTGGGVGGELWGGSEVPGGRCTGSGEEEQSGDWEPVGLRVTHPSALASVSPQISISLTLDERSVWAMCHPHSSAQLRAPAGKK